jgi:hypothetical protein
MQTVMTISVFIRSRLTAVLSDKHTYSWPQKMTCIILHLMV